MIIRRFFPLLFLSLATGVALAQGSGAALDPLPESEFTREAAAHLLRRAGLDGPPEEIAALHKRGLAGAVAWLTDYEPVKNDHLPAFVPSLVEVPNFREMGALTPEKRMELFQEYRRKDVMQLQALRAWWLDRMARTARPLEEKLTLFWHGHFTSGHRDVKNAYHMYIQNTLLRRHATGNFGQLVKQIARDPAMLEYLDNRVNRKGSPNENFARELMELFTLGIGNYTEKDIKEAARAFTGWTFQGNQYVFRPFMHDSGQKTVLGRTGNLNGDDVVEILLAQPASARHIAAKLFRFLAHDEPSEEVIAGLADTFRSSGWEIKPLLRRVLLSREFYSQRAVGNMIKGPVYMVVSLMRNLRLDPSFSLLLANAAGKLGQMLFEPPNVKGWAGGRDWITTSILYERYNLSSAMVAGEQELNFIMRSMRGRVRRFMEMQKSSQGMDPESMSGPAYMGLDDKDPVPFDVLSAVKGLDGAEAVVDALCRRFLAIPAPAELRATLLEYARKGKLDDRQHLHGLLKLIVSTPEFQLC